MLAAAVLAAALAWLTAAAAVAQVQPAATDIAAGAPFDDPRIVIGDAQGAHSVRAADFDRDGDLDLLSASRDDKRIIWYRNNGVEQPFEVKVVAANVPCAYQALPADLNGDGRVDILAVSNDTTKCGGDGAGSNSGSVRWFENNGDNPPAFAEWTIATATNLAYSVSAAAADIDGDGDVDFALATRDDNSIRWYENNGDNPPAFAPRLVSNAADGAVSVDAGDVDGDGDIDLASASENDNKLAWYANNGARPPAFTAHVIRTGNPDPARLDLAKAVHLADLNGDGALDVAYASESNNEIGWYKNDGAPVPAWALHVVATDRNHAKHVSSADLDSDGDLDILAASSDDHTVAIYQNDGRPDPAFTAHVLTSGAPGARFVAAADLDGDGDPDVMAAARDSDQVIWFRNRLIHRSALYPAQGHVVLGAYPDRIRHIVGGDLDGDGDLDAAIVGDTNLIWYENNNGSPPQFQAHGIPTSVRGGRWVQAADMDRDGDLDLLVASNDSAQVLWYENRPDRFAEHILAAGISGPRAVLAADLDGDGDLDAYAAFDEEADDGIGKVAWFENNGARPPTFVQRPVGDAPYARSVDAADFDGDGDLDLVAAATNDRKVLWWENRGDRTFIARGTVGDGMNGVQHVQAADMDGDGDMDVLSAAEFVNHVMWHENLDGRGGAWAARLIDGAAPGAHSVYAADADSDGDLDIAVAVEHHYGNRVGAFVWYEHNGAQPPAFTKHFIYGPAAVPHHAAFADADGDGDFDMFGTSRDDGRAYWFENLGGQVSLTYGSATAVPGRNAVGLPLRLEHRGRNGDSAAQAASLVIDLLDAAGNRLSQAQVRNIAAALTVHRDANANGALDGGDPAIFSTATLQVEADGGLTVPLSVMDDPPRAALGQPLALYVVLDLNSACVGVTPGAAARRVIGAAVDASEPTVTLRPELVRGSGAASATPVDTAAFLRINEIVADNKDGMVDPDDPGQHPDWIEIYNTGPYTVNLGGMHLSDDPAQPTRFRIADGVAIAPYRFLVFIADGEPEQGPLHTNFKLDRLGEEVLLRDVTTRANRVLDNVSYTALDTDKSVGRLPDGSAAWGPLPAPSPGATNALGGLDIHYRLPMVQRGSTCLP